MKRSLSFALAISCAAAADATAQVAQVAAPAVGATAVNFNALVIGTAGTALFAGFPGVTVSAGCFVANTFSSANFGAGNSVQASNTAAGGGSSCAGSTFNPVTLTFATPLNYFGLVGVANPNGGATPSIMLNVPVGEVNVTTSSFGTGIATFVGLTSTVPFTTVTISANSNGSNGAFAVDDITFRASSVVPEPSSMLLVAAGLAAVATMARRKRSV